MTKFRRAKLGRAKHEWQWHREWGEDSEGGILERDAAVRSRIKMVVVAVLLGAVVSCLAGCYVIVPVINFGELTIPMGDMGFLNKYEDEDNYDMRRFEGLSASEILWATGGHSEIGSRPSERSMSPTAGEILFKNK